MTANEQAETDRLLGESRLSAPDTFVESVMDALPERPNAAWTDRFGAVWPARPAAWLLPSLAGVTAALLGMVAVSFFRPPADAPAPAVEMVAVTFELHAPEAERVELLGSFNNWQPGELRLDGPDADGHWTATLSLPEGRHEYIFLVDGRTWAKDPTAEVLRPDGFGNMNVVLEI